jgi:hypothetical protein
MDPAQTIVLCFEYGGFDEKGLARRLLLMPSSLQWIKATFPPENVFSVNIEPYLCARNRAIRDCVLPVAAERGFEWLLSIDNDVTITHPGVEMFLRAQGDVVACRCPMPKPHAWEDPGAFHTPLWRCRVSMLRAIQPPWFDFVYSEDNCRLLTCDCQYFAAKCRAAGFSVGHAGHSGHGNQGSAWWPNCHSAPDLLGGQIPPGAITQRLIDGGRLI